MAQAAASASTFVDPRIAKSFRRDAALGMACLALFAAVVVAKVKFVRKDAPTWMRRASYLPVGIAGGLALSMTVGKAVLFGVLAASTYPVRGFRVFDKELEHDLSVWPAKGLSQIELPSASIQMHVLPGNPTGAHFGEAVIFFWSNAELYTSHGPWEFSTLTEQGYKVVNYDPPGYGQSTGWRFWPQDLEAAQAVMGAVQRDHRADQIHLIGRSIGSTLAVALARRFSVASLTLVNPLARLEHCADNMVGPRLGWFVHGTCQRYFAYDNDRGLKATQAQRVALLTATHDRVMRGEAELLQEALRTSGKPGRHVAQVRNGHNDSWHVPGIIRCSGLTERELPSFGCGLYELLWPSER